MGLRQGLSSLGGNQTNQKNPSPNGGGPPREQEVLLSRSAEERVMGRVSREDHAAEPVRKTRLPGGLKASQEGSGDGCLDAGGAPRFKRCLVQTFSLFSGICGCRAGLLGGVSPAREDCHASACNAQGSHESTPETACAAPQWPGESKQPTQPGRRGLQHLITIPARADPRSALTLPS